MISKNFIEDLERIFDAAMKKGNYNAALSAKRFQRQLIAENTKITIQELDDETLRGLIGEGSI